jgi:hypothetical protein
MLYCKITTGSCGPVSPSLSARLCSGNGELLKYNEEDGPLSEEICLGRQELY